MSAMPFESCLSPLDFDTTSPPPLPLTREYAPARRVNSRPKATRFSLVIPVYKNEASLGRLIETLRCLNDRLEGMLQVVFVVDGSPDRSYEILRDKLSEGPFAAELVSLSRNFGSFSAIRMGLSLARGPFFAVMAADLQEPPELVAEFFRSLAEEPVDIVLGVRSDRDDPLLSKTSANVFWSIYRRFVQRDMPPGGIDAFACNQQVRDALMALNESNTSLVGQVLWLGFRRKHVPYRRLPRKEGKSGWTFRRKLRYMFDSIFAFTDLPLTLLMVTGTLGVLFSTIIGTAVFVAWCLGAITAPGYTPVVLAILLSMFCQLMGLGVIGAYVWRGYENTKRRPAFIPMLHESFQSRSGVSPLPADSRSGVSPLFAQSESPNNAESSGETPLLQKCECLPKDASP
jgi:polyisoprenyl-phosphate glycosyltransferase